MACGCGVHWLPAIADGHGVACATFVIVQPSTIAFLGSRAANAAARPHATWEDFTAPPEWCGGPSSSFPPSVAYRRHEAQWMAGAFRPNASGVSDMDRMWGIIEGSRLTIFRSCEELDPGVFALLSDIFQRPAVPAGILFQPDFSDADDNGDERPEVLKWLDNQPPKSVIYVALGSEAPLTAATLHELALGLELAGVRFLWAFRKPAGMSAPDSDVATLLPPGFAERTRGRGLVLTGWVPQVRVLAHAGVGAFLTHCGWGSTVESLAFGHPMVMLPFVLDQPLVARTNALRGVGVEVPRDEADGSFVREDVAAAVRRVMVEGEGKVFASNAAKLKEVLVDQRRQDGYMDVLVDYLRRYKDNDCTC